MMVNVVASKSLRTPLAVVEASYRGAGFQRAFLGTYSATQGLSASWPPSFLMSEE